MSGRLGESKETWERSFREQKARGAYNTAPVEALVRNVSYYLRERYPEGLPPDLHFLELGCGAGPNLRWLAEKGIRVSGIDLSGQALDLCRGDFARTTPAAPLGFLGRASVTHVPAPDCSVDGIIEACVFQHLRRPDRVRAFAEVGRVLRPGGLFAGYMLEAGHTVFRARSSEQLPDDPGTLYLDAGGKRLHLEDLGVCHFFTEAEVRALLGGFSHVSTCPTTYAVPEAEARRRGFPEYVQSMLAVYAIR